MTMQSRFRDKRVTRRDSVWGCADGGGVTTSVVPLPSSAWLMLSGWARWRASVVKVGIEERRS